jgi:hypothetical protein
LLPPRCAQRQCEAKLPLRSSTKTYTMTSYNIESMATAKIHITKLAAAERQLRAAIRMYFGGEDELAVHTVAVASYRLITDLKAERGMNEAADNYLTSLFYVVRDYRRGTLPEQMTTDTEVMAWVCKLAEQIPIQADTKIEDCSVSLSRQATIEFWNKRNKIANFLKHADRDSKAAISLDEVDNLLLLMQCYGAYIDLTHDDLGNEGLVLKLFIEANEPSHTVPASEREKLVQQISEVPEEDRQHMCGLLITKLNEDETVT